VPLSLEPPVPVGEEAEDTEALLFHSTPYAK
jgi:hypothetical protein